MRRYHHQRVTHLALDNFLLEFVILLARFDVTDLVWTYYQKNVDEMTTTTSTQIERVIYQYFVQDGAKTAKKQRQHQ